MLYVFRITLHSQKVHAVQTFEAFAPVYITKLPDIFRVFMWKFVYLVNNLHRNSISVCKQFWPECLLVANPHCSSVMIEWMKTFTPCARSGSSMESSLMKWCNLQKLLLGCAVLLSGMRVLQVWNLLWFFQPRAFFIVLFVVQLEALFISSFSFMQ